MFSECERPDLFSDFEGGVAICVKYDKAPVYFLLSQRGNAIEIHIAADGRKGKKALRMAGGAIIVYIKTVFPWCKMLIAGVTDKSVYNLCEKLGFSDFGLVGNEVGQFNMMVIEYEQCNK